MTGKQRIERIRRIVRHLDEVALGKSTYLVSDLPCVMELLDALEAELDSAEVQNERVVSVIQTEDCWWIVEDDSAAPRREAYHPLSRWGFDKPGVFRICQLCTETPKTTRRLVWPKERREQLAPHRRTVVHGELYDVKPQSVVVCKLCGTPGNESDIRCSYCGAYFIGVQYVEDEADGTAQ